MAHTEPRSQPAWDTQGCPVFATIWHVVVVGLQKYPGVQASGVLALGGVHLPPRVMPTHVLLPTPPSPSPRLEHTPLAHSEL